MKYFKLPYLLFYLLTLIDFFFIGMTVSAVLGVAKGQGLAGGAIVFGYGVMTALVAFIAAIGAAGTLGMDRIVRLNKVLAIMLLIFSLIFIYRFQTRDHQEDDTDINKKPTKELWGYIPGKTTGEAVKMIEVIPVPFPPA